MRRVLAICFLLLASAALAGAGTVTDLEGGATRQAKGAAAPVGLKVGDAVEVGDTLEVAAGGNLAVTLTDESVIALGEGSRLTLDEARFGDQGSTVFSAKLLLGSLWAKVTKLVAGSDSKFEVITERAIAGVRGTIFTVDLASQDADVEVGVEEGEVEVAHAAEAQGAGAQRRFSKRERIAAGDAVTFGAKGLARHRFELRRARMAAFVGKHRDGWLKRALQRERLRQEKRDLRREERRRR